MVAQRTVELSEQIRRKEQALADLAQAQERLVELSRLSGMAEVASGVLHNVGNVLNSVNVSATVVAEKIGGLRVNHLAAAIELLERHTGSIDSFLRDDPKGQRVLPYLTKLGKNLQDEREVALAELRQLEEHIEHIKAVLSTQQKYARVSSVMESASVVILVEDALRVVRPEFEQHHIRIEREFAELPPVDADRHRILQILVNLLRNAKDAVVQNPDGPRTVGVTVRLVDEAHFRVEVKDSGVGLAREDLTRIFAHGFTTKALGHGFGLHSGALAARQMSGSLWAESDGPGFGATFILELPVSRSQHRSAA
jgi:two-component system NtrC family sensor kinase